MINIWKL